MKRYIILILLTVFTALLFSNSTGSSTAFSGSFLQRVSGSEALYWNPANINRLQRTGFYSLPYVSPSPTHPRSFFTERLNHELLILPYSISLENNALSLDLYNSFAGELINDSHRRKISKSIDKSLFTSFNLNTIFIGYTYKNYAFSTAINAVGKGHVDKEFVDILLYGNKITTLDDEVRLDHTFDKEHNKFGALAYQDYSLGYGGYRLNDLYPAYLDEYPSIYGGISMSYLAGYSHIETIDFKGELSSHEEEGLYLDQQIVVREALKRPEGGDNMPSVGVFGSGFKMSIGFSSDVIEIATDHYMSFGLAFDNMFGFLKWNKETRKTYYSVLIDTVHIKDLEEDLIIDKEYSEDISSYTTKLPFVTRFGVKYTYTDLVASLDYAQNHGNEKIYINDPEISLGLEYPAYYSWLPARIGFRLPIGDYQAAYSFGLGLHFKNFETGFGYQSTGAFFTSKAKGFELGAYMRVRY